MSTATKKSIDDAFVEIRAIVNDSDKERFTDTLLMTKFNTALREVYRYRPDSLIGNFVQGVFSRNPMLTFSVDDDLAQIPPTDFPVDELYFAPLTFYVAGMLDLSDDEFSDDNRAMTMLTSFRSMLIGAGG